MKKKSVSQSFDTYIRVADAAALLAGVQFPPEVWAVFAHTEQPITARTLAERLALDEATVASALRRLSRRKLIRKHLLNWDEYSQQTTPAGVLRVATQPVVAPVVVASVAPQIEVTPVAAPVVLETRAVAAVAQPVVNSPILACRCVNLAASQERKALRERQVHFVIESADVVATQQTQSPAIVSIVATNSSAKTVPVAAPAQGWRLRPLIEAIMAKKGGIAGQFLVYRVFLRVPPEMMAAAGLKSLSLVDDEFRIRDPLMLEAVISAAREVADIDLTPVAA